MLSVPWRDPEGGSEFIDLRANPYDLYLLAEAERYPPLMQALRSLNATRSPVFTAKCDVWSMDSAEREDLRLHLDLQHADSNSGYASYIDTVWRDRSIFTSRHRHEQILDRLVRVGLSVQAPLSALECVLRPAVIDFGETWEGYAVTIYIKAVGADEDHSLDEWGRTMGEVVKVLRGREPSSR